MKLSVAQGQLGECYLQLRERDIAGEEFFSLYDTNDWPHILQVMKENYQVQIGLHKEIWLVYFGAGPKEQVLLWVSGEGS